MGKPSFVVVGGGQAGLQICESLRKSGYDGDLTLVAEEATLPYQRPPLSKKFLAGEVEEARLLFRPAPYFEKLDVTVRLGTQASALDAQGHTLTLSDGSVIGYDKLALTLGARNRPLPCPGGDTVGVHYVRSLEDSRGLALSLAQSQRLAIIGGGFIGLEVAAVAASMGKTVIVIEMQDRLLARVVAPRLSDFYADLHRSHDVVLRLGSAVEKLTSLADGIEVCISGPNGRSAEVVDCVVAGIGVQPNQELAEKAGLACDGGILVDIHGRTSDPDIVAAGDCTMHDNGFLGRRVRLESVQNAVDQAKVAAGTMLGQEDRYCQVPWFWSDQYDAKLQIAGIGAGHDHAVLRGDVGNAAFTEFYFKAGQLIGADSINRPQDHMACRKLLAQSVPVTAAQIEDPQVDLMQLARQAAQ